MMWFFAILIVLVMGGVAAMAAGRGAPMSRAYGDRPDVLVPKDGPLRPEDVRLVRFSLAFRGYRMSEVDALLNRVAQQLEDTVPPPPVPTEASTEAPTEAPAAVPPAEPLVSDDRAGEDQVADTPADREVRGDDPSV